MAHDPSKCQKGNPRPRPHEQHLRGPSDIRAGEAAAMVMKASQRRLPPREEEPKPITGVLSRDCRGARGLGFTLILLTATFGDCLIRAHYKHQVTSARS